MALTGRKTGFKELRRLDLKNPETEDSTGRSGVKGEH